MIHIEKPFITEEGDRAFLRAKVNISDDTAEAYVKAITLERYRTVFLTDEDYPPVAWKDDGNLWFEVPIEFGKFLCSERSNAFVIALFWYAMVTGSDIVFEAPISKRLYDGITKELMPELEKNGFATVALKGPVTSEPVWCEGCVVTGMSGGVDSFYTVKCYGSDSVEKDKRLTHLSYYNSAYLFKPYILDNSLEAIYKDARAIRAIILESIKAIALQKGYPLVVTNTNLDRDYYRGGLIFTAMYRFLACTLALEHLYSLYISSSSGHESSLVKASLFAPTQSYEEVLCRSLRTETLRYMSSDKCLRTEKIREIADDELFRKYAKVCFDTGRNGENCGVCFGCLKTIIPLDLQGKLDGFEKSFDLDTYRRNKEELFRFFVEFSKNSEADATRTMVHQLLDIANKEKSEAGDMFIRAYEDAF